LSPYWLKADALCPPHSQLSNSLNSTLWSNVLLSSISTSLLLTWPSMSICIWISSLSFPWLWLWVWLELHLLWATIYHKELFWVCLLLPLSWVWSVCSYWPRSLLTIIWRASAGSFLISQSLLLMETNRIMRMSSSTTSSSSNLSYVLSQLKKENHISNQSGLTTT